MAVKSHTCLRRRLVRGQPAYYPLPGYAIGAAQQWESTLHWKRKAGAKVPFSTGILKTMRIPIARFYQHGRASKFALLMAAVLLAAATPLAAGNRWARGGGGGQGGE